MTLSIWRYSHLVLAIASSLFLLVASITGVILAVEPINDKLQPFRIANLEGLSLAETLENVNARYDDVLGIAQDKNGFISATVIVDNKNTSFYIDPTTGEKLGNLIEKAPVYQFATNLHRSLFLKTPGRLFIGLTSLLLFFIAVSGIVLIAKRQGGAKRFFAPVVRENFSQYHHVVYSRVVLIPIVVLALSGVYLSLHRFDLIPETQVAHTVNFDHLKEEPQRPYSDFELFKNTPLSQLRELEYPFSEFVEDYYVVRLKKKEVLLNQYTGEVLSESNYPMLSLVSDWATVLHTGQGSIWWSIILGLGSLAIPFLMFTGFVVYFKRPKTKIKNPFSKDKAQYVILVGSEGGTTLQYAQLLHAQLLALGQKSYLAMMDDYTLFKNMDHLILMTATYGQGEAPSSALKFETLLKKQPQKRPYHFTVVGFGSTSYPHFCQYAHEAYDFLEQAPQARPLMKEVFTINDHSFEAFGNWATAWGALVGHAIRLEKPKSMVNDHHKSAFIVLDRTEEMIDDTFLLTLKNTNGANPDSGDLLSVIPGSGHRERLYSLGKLDDNILAISVKRHVDGLCSNYLLQLKKGATLTASIVENKNFHFPKKAKKTVLIATGTGIGPFLGMIKNNTGKSDIHLYWGGRTENSLTLYKPFIDSALEQGKLSKFVPAYSRTQTEKKYVQHLIRKDGEHIAGILRKKGCVMICGSLAMQKEVLQELQLICNRYLKKDLSFYQNRKQIKIDCY